MDFFKNHTTVLTYFDTEVKYHWRIKTKGKYRLYLISFISYILKMNFKF